MQKSKNQAQIPKTSEEPVMDFLEKVQKLGIPFFVDGEAMPPEKTSLQAVKEAGCYMTDYVLDETGQIKQVRFDKINMEP